MKYGGGSAYKQGNKQKNLLQKAASQRAAGSASPASAMMKAGNVVPANGAGMKQSERLTPGQSYSSLLSQAAQGRAVPDVNAEWNPGGRSGQGGMQGMGAGKPGGAGGEGMGGYDPRAGGQGIGTGGVDTGYAGAVVAMMAQS